MVAPDLVRVESGPAGRAAPPLPAARPGPPVLPAASPAPPLTPALDIFSEAPPVPPSGGDLMFGMEGGADRGGGSPGGVPASGPAPARQPSAPPEGGAGAPSTPSFAPPGPAPCAPGDEELHRARSRAAKAAEVSARSQAALAARAAADADEESRRERRRLARHGCEDVVQKWRKDGGGNLRTLLGSVDRVLWPACGFERPGLAQLVTDKDVKRTYMKCLLHVHPDKVRARPESTEEEVARADLVFDALKEAWSKFGG